MVLHTAAAYNNQQICWHVQAAYASNAQQDMLTRDLPSRSTRNMAFDAHACTDAYTLADLSVPENQVTAAHHTESGRVTYHPSTSCASKV